MYHEKETRNQNRLMACLVWEFCGCWELNLGPLKDQPVLLTKELSRQPVAVDFISIFYLSFMLPLAVGQVDLSGTVVYRWLKTADCN